MSNSNSIGNNSSGSNSSGSNSSISSSGSSDHINTNSVGAVIFITLLLYSDIFTDTLYESFTFFWVQ